MNYTLLFLPTCIGSCTACGDSTHGYPGPTSGDSGRPDRTGGITADSTGALLIAGDVITAIEIGDEISALTITGTLGADLTCDTLGNLTVAGGVLAASTITVTTLGSLVVGTDTDDPPNFDGRLNLLDDIPDYTTGTDVVKIWGERNGTIDLDNGGVANKAMLRTERGGSGHLVNGGAIS